MNSHTVPPRAPWLSNALWAYALQAANYLLPLIVLPFLLQQLGAAAFGELAFAQATMMFAVLLIDAGLDTVGARELSRTDNPSGAALTITAISLIKLVLIAVVVTLAATIIAALPSTIVNGQLMLVMLLLLPGSLLFPTWLFQGLEIMHHTTIYGVAGRLVATLGIVTFVDGPDDLLLAAALQASATLLSGLLCLPVLLRRLGLTLAHPIQTLRQEITRILRMSRQLMAAEFLSRSLNNSTVFVLGLFAGNATVGAYAALEKLVRALHGMQLPLIASLYPRFCNKWQAQTPTEAPRMRWVIATLLALTALACITAATTGPWLLDLLFGSELTPYSDLFQALCLWLFFASTSTVLGTLWLLAAGHGNVFAKVMITTSAAQLLALLLGTFVAGLSGLVAALVLSEAVRAALLALECAGRAGVPDGGRSCAS